MGTSLDSPTPISNPFTASRIPNPGAWLKVGGTHVIGDVVACVNLRLYALGTRPAHCGRPSIKDIPVFVALRVSFKSRAAPGPSERSSRG